MKLIDITGQRFGRLVVIDLVGPCKNGGSLWRCLCDCGKHTEVRSLYLRSGHTESCGCLCHERLLASNITHGKCLTPEHIAWKSIKQRCTNPKYKEFYLYGGRGIKMCDRWAASFEAFLQDLGNRPGDGFSIERKDVNGDYEALNCIWATAKEQGRNKRNTVKLSFKGETKSLMDWSEIVGIKDSVIRDRLRDGWTIEEALATAPRRSPCVAI